VKRETLKKIIACCPEGTPLDVLLADSIDKASEIARQVRTHNRLLHEEALRHEAAVNELRQRLAETQSACEHLETTYHPDASGGSDSSTTCDICGAEVR